MADTQMKRFLTLLSLVAVTPLALAQAQSLDAGQAHDHQWSFRGYDGSGSRKPSATFLSWNNSSVMFHAYCAQPNEFTLDYYFAPGRLPPEMDLTLQRGNLTVRSTGDRTQRPFRMLRIAGNFDIDDNLLSLLTPSSDELQIGPWFVGQAQPLLELARACKS